MSSVAATNAALAVGGMTHFSLGRGSRRLFLASVRSCCRCPVRRFPIRPPSPQEAQEPLRTTHWRFGAGGHDQLGLLLAVEDAGNGRTLARLAGGCHANPLFDKPRRVRCTVVRLVSRACAMRSRSGPRSLWKCRPLAVSAPSMSGWRDGSSCRPPPRGSATLPRSA